MTQKGKKLIVGQDVICPKCDGFAEKFETVLSKIVGLDKNITAQFVYMDEKTSNAKVDMERRLEGMNEFRAQLAKQAGEFITRQELQLMFDKQGARIDGLADRLGVTRDTASLTIGERKGATRYLEIIATACITFIVLLIVKYVGHF